MEIEGRSAEELCQEAFEFLQQGRLAAAVERLEKVLAARPDYFDAHHYLGMAYGYMGRLEEAEEHLRKAVELFPDNAPARYNLGLILQYRGKQDEALREFRASLGLNPYYEPVRKILTELGEPVEQMVEEILEAEEAAKEEKKTFAEKFAEAPWAALKEKEAEVVALPPVKEKPVERPLSNFWARAVTTLVDSVFLLILTIGVSFALAPFLELKGFSPPMLLERLRREAPSLPAEGRGERRGPPPGIPPGAPGGEAMSKEELRKETREGAPEGPLSKEKIEKLLKEAAEEAEATPMGQRLMGLIIPLGLPFLYFALAWAIFGKSLGMALLGLELTDISFSKAAPWRGVVRWIVFYLPTIGFYGVWTAKPSMLILQGHIVLVPLALFSLLLFLVNVVLISATERKQAVHDLAAGTLVVGRSIPTWLGVLIVVGFFIIVGLAPFALFKGLGPPIPSP